MDPEAKRSFEICSKVLSRTTKSNGNMKNKRFSASEKGKVTNASIQKIWALISFFTDNWKTDRKPVGSDLGQGLFKFEFELESDLLAILDKRPYHYARWMVILQRWEPTTSPSFPSLIQFWIQIQGIPIHLWTQVTATFVYERLERHCSVCYRLDHEVKDCLEAKAQKRALLAKKELNETTLKQTLGGENPDNYLNTREVFRFSASRKKDDRVEEGSNANHNRSSHRSIEFQSRRHYDERRPNSRFREGSINSHSSRHPTRYEDPMDTRVYKEFQREVREAMAQYTSCPDPTESAARKERMRQAEVKGESEAIALRMAQTRLEASNSPAPRQTGEQDNQGSKKRIPAALRLGPPNEPDMDDEGNNEGRRPISLERTHVTQRLGPLGGSNQWI
ncbi:hypothetical protein Bca4012_017970 [Brassica carinata]